MTYILFLGAWASLVWTVELLLESAGAFKHPNSAARVHYKKSKTTVNSTFKNATNIYFLD